VECRGRKRTRGAREMGKREAKTSRTSQESGVRSQESGVRSQEKMGDKGDKGDRG
jgi:hypothetical protein